MSKSDGGPAFPHMILDEDDNTNYCIGGMSLRDYFAAVVLPQCIADRDEHTSIEVASAISVRAAYIYADAMIAERGK